MAARAGLSGRHGRRSAATALAAVDRKTVTTWCWSTSAWATATASTCWPIAAQNHPRTTVILLTGYGTVETAVEAIRAGAFDFLTKPLIDEELEMAIERALNQRKVIEENKNLKAQLDLRFGMENIVGHDHRMLQRVRHDRQRGRHPGHGADHRRKRHRQVADRPGHPSPQRAGATSRSSKSPAGPCPRTLLESELFGHVAGAFTGATGDKLGKFMLADGGTIFLDEIGTASPGMQVKLLRVLQEIRVRAGRRQQDLPRRYAG